MSKETSKQVTPPEKRNPTGKGGFGDNPQNRSDGRWKAEDTISFQYKKFMRMTVVDLNQWAKDNADKMTVAQVIAYNRLIAARKNLMDAKEVTDRTEGKAQQSIDVTTGGEQIQTVVKIIDARQDDRSTDSD